MEDLVLPWDRKNAKAAYHGKFYSLWLGPYLIDSLAGPTTLYWADLDGEREQLPVNGQRFKLLHWMLKNGLEGFPG